MTDRVVKHSAGLPREFAVEVTPGGALDKVGTPWAGRAFPASGIL